jgi:hypothetical protein
MLWQAHFGGRAGDPPWQLDPRLCPQAQQHEVFGVQLGLGGRGGRGWHRRNDIGFVGCLGSSSSSSSAALQRAPAVSAAREDASPCGTRELFTFPLGFHAENQLAAGGLDT